MNHLQLVPLRELVTKVGAGATPLGGHLSYQASGIPLIRSQNVQWGEFSREGLAFISEAQDASLSGSRVRSGDVLLNITGASIGRACVVPAQVCPANVNQHVAILRPGPELDARFLALFLVGPPMQKRIGQLQAGATRQALTKSQIEDFLIPRLSLVEQRQIANSLTERMAAAEDARRAVVAQGTAALALPFAWSHEDTADPRTTTRPLGEVLEEVTVSIGAAWRGQPVLGATRAGLAPAKEGVGKQPHRYKPVTPGTVFYNPMRILLGSIALVDDNDTPGITSPDYVVVRGREGLLHPVWFYHWFRSPAGAEFIQSLTRGAVRERLLFNRVAVGRIPVPSWSRQLATVERARAAEKARLSFSARLKLIEKLPAKLLREAFGEGGSESPAYGMTDALMRDEATAAEAMA